MRCSTGTEGLWGSNIVLSLPVWVWPLGDTCFRLFCDTVFSIQQSIQWETHTSIIHSAERSWREMFISPQAVEVWGPGNPNWNSPTLMCEWEKFSQKFCSTLLVCNAVWQCLFSGFVCYSGPGTNWTDELKIMAWLPETAHRVHRN